MSQVTGSDPGPVAIRDSGSGGYGEPSISVLSGLFTIFRRKISSILQLGHNNPQIQDAAIVNPAIKRFFDIKLDVELACIHYFTVMLAHRNFDLRNES